MNEHQQKVLAEVPILYKPVFERAYAGNRPAAVKAFCLYCVGYLRAEVTNCTAFGCPLHPLRPYQSPADSAADALETSQAAEALP